MLFFFFKFVIKSCYFDLDFTYLFYKSMSLLFLLLILILLLSCYIPGVPVTWAYTTTNVGMYNKPDNKPVVVLGATGKVGRLVVSKLLKKGGENIKKKKGKQRQKKRNSNIQYP